jgi:transposase
MRTNHYPSDLTDAQWGQIEPQLPPEPGGGRPRKTDPRDVLDSILYILRTVAVHGPDCLLKTG